MSDVTIDPTVDATGEIRSDELQVCPGCGMVRPQWRENDGAGFEGDDGLVYCCRGCAQQTGCTCTGR